MSFGNWTFQGLWPWTFKVTTMIDCPYLWVVCNNAAPPHRYIAVGQSEAGYPIQVHRCAEQWKSMSMGDLYYYHFSTRPEVYSIEERQVIIGDLVIICKPLCPN
jgi:hypothetical protein